MTLSGYALGSVGVVYTLAQKFVTPDLDQKALNVRQQYTRFQSGLCNSQQKVPNTSIIYKHEASPAIIPWTATYTYNTCRYCLYKQTDINFWTHVAANIMQAKNPTPQITDLTCTT